MICFSRLQSCDVVCRIKMESLLERSWAYLEVLRSIEVEGSICEVRSQWWWTWCACVDAKIRAPGKRRRRL